MAFTKKTWKDRLVEYAGRRKITNVSTMAAQVVDVERAEGIVSEEGSAFSAASMNDLEQRVSDGFTSVQNSVNGVISDFAAWFGVTPDGERGWKEPGADTVYPFNSGSLLLCCVHLCSYKTVMSTVKESVYNSDYIDASEIAPKSGSYRYYAKRDMTALVYLGKGTEDGEGAQLQVNDVMVFKYGGSTYLHYCGTTDIHKGDSIRLMNNTGNNSTPRMMLILDSDKIARIE